MSQRNDTLSMRQMLDHAREAIAMAEGRTLAELGDNRVLELALVRLVEVVGEAATRVSPEGRQRYPSVPWRGVVGMRNRLIHGCDVVDLQILWDTIHADLPRLVQKVERVLPPTET
jgi:uncharacterized protein with HEPN domain